MEFTKSRYPDEKAQAIEDARSRIGEPITEAQANAAALEDCECKEGMFALGPAEAVGRCPYIEVKQTSLAFAEVQK